MIGGSGSGKSVAMKHILGMFTPDSGQVTLWDQELASLSSDAIRELRTRVGMLFQHSALLDSLTVLENVMFPLVERRVASREDARRRATDVLAKLKLDDVLDAFPSDISNGEQKRVSLARALVTEPRMVIYDEPTTGQDPILSRKVEAMILDAQEEFGLTSIVVSHDMASTFRIADHVIMLNKGHIVAEGPPAELLNSTDPEVRKFVFAAEVGD
jgi:ABC-type transporter Mla maintaining outer membrane lipid asymmetry ATPase subunit MlaF